MAVVKGTVPEFFLNLSFVCREATDFFFFVCVCVNVVCSHFAE